MGDGRVRVRYDSLLVSADADASVALYVYEDDGSVSPPIELLSRRTAAWLWSKGRAAGELTPDEGLPFGELKTDGDVRFFREGTPVPRQAALEEIAAGVVAVLREELDRWEAAEARHEGPSRN